MWRVIDIIIDWNIEERYLKSMWWEGRLRNLNLLGEKVTSLEGLEILIFRGLMGI